MIALLLLLVMPASFIDSTNTLYARQDAEGLGRLCQAPPTRELDLLCLYRLYPLTGDESLLRGLPTTLRGGGASELALLSGLWGFRAAQAGFAGMMRDGLRAENLLREARAADPFDPFVLLVEGQSLMFKPAFAGGDERRALERFRRLRKVLEADTMPPIALVEADIWIWYSMQRIGLEEAPETRRRLLAAHPPELYRDFLLDPP